MHVIAGEEAEFEAAMRQATPLIEATPGFGCLSLRKCLERSNQYLLTVTWSDLESHTEGFRQSDRYPKWRDLLHHFYDPFPTVEHYEDSSLL